MDLVARRKIIASYGAGFRQPRVPKKKIRVSLQKVASATDICSTLNSEHTTEDEEQDVGDILGNNQTTEDVVPDEQTDRNNNNSDIRTVIMDDEQEASHSVLSAIELSPERTSTPCSPPDPHKPPLIEEEEEEEEEEEDQHQPLIVTCSSQK